MVCKYLGGCWNASVIKMWLKILIIQGWFEIACNFQLPDLIYISYCTEDRTNVRDAYRAFSNGFFSISDSRSSQKYVFRDFAGLIIRYKDYIWFPFSSYLNIQSSLFIKPCCIRFVQMIFFTKSCNPNARFLIETMDSSKGSSRGTRTR